MEITKKSALDILQSRVLINESGKYTVKVTSTNVFQPEEGQARTIVNFAAMTPYHAQEAIKALKADDYAAAVNKTSMTASQLNGQFVPQNGETVDIEVGTHTNKEGIEILVVTSVIARKAVAAKKFTLELVEEPEMA